MTHLMKTQRFNMQEPSENRVRTVNGPQPQIVGAAGRPARRQHPLHGAAAHVLPCNKAFPVFILLSARP